MSGVLPEVANLVNFGGVWLTGMYSQYACNACNSITVQHYLFLISSVKDVCRWPRTRRSGVRTLRAHHKLCCDCFGPVAQLDRASDFGSEGWGFDSLRGHQL
jgi:hypothetical protein